jgi:hypothetical protein
MQQLLFINKTHPRITNQKEPLDYHDDIGIKMQIDVIIT